MSTVPFITLWPGGNTTALVRRAVERPRQPFVARQIMAAHSAIEQVGFWETSADARAAGRLQMMGGEFCGNATRCAGYVLARELGRSEAELMLEVSGIPELVTVAVRHDEVSVTLPGAFFQNLRRDSAGTIVDLLGIRHLVVDGPVTAGRARHLIARYRDDHPAVGVIGVDQNAGALVITPYVWVRATDTCVAESACGSGSIAAAIAAANRGLAGASVVVQQPSGSIYLVKLMAVGDGFSGLGFSGIVKILPS